MKKEVHLFVTPLVHHEYAAKKVEELCEKLGANFFMEETTTYSFNELPENAQEMVIERNRDINVHFNWWEYTIKEWKDKLSEIGFDDADIRFSGFWSQGDGASFTAYCDTQKILNTLLVCEGSITNWKQWRLWFELAENGIFKFDIARIGHNYVHENSVQGVIHDDFGGFNNRMWYASNPKEPYNYTCKFEQKANLTFLEEMFNEYVRDLSKKIYSSLEEEYEYLTSNDCIKEYLENQDTEYDEFGNEV